MDMATRHCVKWTVGVWKGNTSYITHTSSLEDMEWVFPGSRHILSKLCFTAAMQPTETGVLNLWAVQPFRLYRGHVFSSKFSSLYCDICILCPQFRVTLQDVSPRDGLQLININQPITYRWKQNLVSICTLGDVEIIELQTTDYRLQTADYRLQTADCRLQTADYRLQTTDFGRCRNNWTTHYFWIAYPSPGGTGWPDAHAREFRTQRKHGANRAIRSLVSIP
jgi:hypothetical protein